jgi:hypothetical protein
MSPKWMAVTLGTLESTFFCLRSLRSVIEQVLSTKSTVAAIHP